MRTLMLLCTVVGLLGLAGPARAQDDPRSVIEKAVKAEGGAEKLSKLGTSRAKARGTMELMGQTIKVTMEAAVHMPDKMRNEMTLDVMGNKVTVIQVLNGGKGWISAAGTTQDMPAQMLDEMKEEMYVAEAEMLTPLLKDKAYTLASLPEIKVNGQAALGVKVSAKGHRDLSLYFDKETGLVIKTERR